MNKSLKSNPRYISISILNDYFQYKPGLKKLIYNYFESNSMTDLDRNLSYEIIKGSVRFLLRIDYLISLFSKIEVRKIELPVLNTLRTAVYQLLYMDRIPAHAIVHESVNIAKKFSLYSSSFVNAVLRKISNIKNLNYYIEKNINKNIKNYYENLSIKYSFPLWLVKYWSESFPDDELEKICSSLNKEPVSFLRINKLKTNKEQLLKIFSGKGILDIKDYFKLDGSNIEKELFSDTLIFKNIRNLENLPGYCNGYFYLQDFSSQVAVKYFLKPKKAEKILDLCGAPGGKATYMSELTKNCSSITSVDINNGKIKVFEDNIKRLGINNIFLIKEDASKLKTTKLNDFYDKVFIDAPCSAFGTISKNPDVKYNKNIEDLERLSVISIEILSKCLDFLKTQGKIFFYTCTLSRIENQQLIKKFLKLNPAKCRSVEFRIPGIIKEYLSEKNIIVDNNENNFFEVMPYYFDSEGGFISIIEKLK